MNVWTEWGKPFGYNWWMTPIHEIKYFFRHFKWSWQRITQGFADKDLWNMDTYWLNTTADMLDRLADIEHGYPGVAPYDTQEKWETALHETAVHLRLATIDYFDDEHKELWLSFKKDENEDDWKAHKRFVEMHRSAAFNWMMENMDHLWD